MSNLHIRIESLRSTGAYALYDSVPQPSQPFCWAESLGDCSVEMDKEHLISSGSITDELVRVCGASWCHGRTSIVPKGHFKSSILCRKHNNQLSGVDQVGASGLHLLEAALLGPPDDSNFESDDPSNDSNKSLWNPSKVTDGNILERWLLKHTINLEVMEDFSIRPPKDIVELVFGRRMFGAGAGLYFLHAVGDTVKPQRGRLEYVRQTTSVNGQERVIGGLFKLRGVDLLICTQARDPLLPFEIGGRTIQFLHRQEKFVFNSTTHETHSMSYKWQSSQSNH